MYPLALVHIGFVPNQDLVDIIRSVLLDVTNPVPYVCNKVKKNSSRTKQKCKKKIKDMSEESLLLKDDSSVTSYTSKMPIAPR